MSSIYIRELESADADAVAALEASYAPSELLFDGDFLHRELTGAVAYGVNLSFGIFDGPELVGYMLVFGEEKSVFPSVLPRKAVYIEDLMVKPAYRRWLFALFSRVAFEIRVLYPGHCLEAHSLEPLVETWKRYGERLHKVGYGLHRYEKTGRQIGGIERYRVQWRNLGTLPVRGAGAAVAAGELYARNYRWQDGYVTVGVVRTEAGWDALEPVWDRLLLRTPGHTVFQSFSYLRRWWRMLRTREELYIVTFTVNGEIVGIAPFQLNPVRRLGCPLRELEFIGARGEVDRPVLLLPEQAVDAVGILGRFLIARRFEWDCISLFEQTDIGLLEQLDRQLEQVLWRSRRFNDTVSTSVDIRGSWEGYLGGKSKKFRKNLRTSRNKLQSQGELIYRHYRSEPEALARLDDHLAVERKSWRASKHIGMGRSPRHELFYRAVAEQFHRDGQFALHLLYLDGVPIASTWGVAYDGTYFALYIAHDSEWNSFSPGTYLESLEIESSFGQGWHTYDPLGGFNSNKSRWADNAVQTQHLVVYDDHPALRASFFLYFKVKPRLKVVTGWVRRQLAEWRSSGRLQRWPALFRLLAVKGITVKNVDVSARGGEPSQE